jgi:hypothetical protein
LTNGRRSRGRQASNQSNSNASVERDAIDARMGEVHEASTYYRPQHQIHGPILQTCTRIGDRGDPAATNVTESERICRTYFARRILALSISIPMSSVSVMPSTSFSRSPQGSRLTCSTRRRWAPVAGADRRLCVRSLQSGSRWVLSTGTLQPTIWRQPRPLYRRLAARRSECQRVGRSDQL